MRAAKPSLQIMWSMWSLILILGIAPLSNAVILVLYGTSLSDSIEADLDQSYKLLNTTYYNCSCHNLFYANGFRGQRNGIATKTVLTAMINYKPKLCVNVFFIDWSEEASASDAFGEAGIKLTYATKAVPASIAIGIELGKQMLKWNKEYCFDFYITHMVGFSLGAQLCGSTGRYVRQNGFSIRRITGLDPAGALFNVFPETALEAECADSVLYLQTNRGGYGINETLGTVNVSPNFGTAVFSKDGVQVQPGCPVGNFTFMSAEDLCHHNRSWELFAEMLNLILTLLASKALNYITWTTTRGTETFALQLFYNISARGNYYMDTNSTPPYGRGVDGLHP